MQTRGYTVLETFVVIALISAIVILFVVFTEDARGRGRDATRSQMISEITKALALYYTGGSSYPLAREPVALTGEDAVSARLIKEKAISSITPDPKSPTLNYWYTSDGQTYTITFCFETRLKGYEKGCNNSVTP